MFHVVFCRAAEPPTGQDIANWVLDAAAFDDEPEFSPAFDKLEGAFAALEVTYAKKKRPVQIERVDGAQLAANVTDAVAAIEEACEPETTAAIVARVRASTQAYLIEFDELGATEDARELVYDLDARIAQELDGIIYVPDEAVYDGGEDNSTLCELT